MASKNTIYVEYLKAAQLIDQTVAFGFRDDKLIPYLGNPNGGEVIDLNGVDPMTWFQTRYASQTNYGWAESDAGQYTPRFYRGGYNYAADRFMRPLSDPEVKEAMRAEEQVDIFEADLIDIGRTVTPSGKNQNVDGSKIRNLLIIAATEMESQCKGILKANGYASPHSTADYVKLCKPMRLDEYSVKLHRHRDYPEIWPFKGWIAIDPITGKGASTKSLPWYDAYNDTKHDRENDFERATLAHALAAVAGVHVLLFAQYGSTFMRQLTRTSFFLLGNYPRWHHKDRTHPPFANEPWVEVKHTF